MQTIWIVEDERQIAEIVNAYLQKEGYITRIFYDGLSVIKALKESKPHLMLLDINLPIYSGIDILNEFRVQSDNPVIFLTSSSDEASRILGFELGADDYVTKPFSPKELVHRVKRIIKRTFGESPKILIASHVWVDVLAYELYIDNQQIDLTANEVKVLLTLLNEKPRVLSRQQIIELTFGYDYDATDRNIDTYIKNIRQKLEHDPKNPQYIKTKYGIGYYFGG